MFTRTVLSLVVLALAAPVWAQVAPKEGTATIAGTVTLKGEPARNVMVVLQTTGNFDQKQTQRVKSDDTGRFRFERVKAGRYTLGAVAPGYATPNENSFGTPGKTVTVAENESLESVELPLKFGAVITGRVTDARGNPVVGEGIELSRLNAQNKPETMWLGPNGNFSATDDRGIYRLFGLPAGRYVVGLGFEQRPNSITLTSRRIFYPKTYHPDVTNIAEAKIVTVSEGQEATGIDISLTGLKKNYDITGRATYAETGQPAVGVEIGYGSVNAESGRVGAWGRNNARSNAAGEFRVQNILPGKYAAFAIPEKEDNSYSTPIRFELNENDVEGLELKLYRGSSLSGIAVVEGASDPSLLAKLSTIQFFTNITSTALTAPINNSRLTLSRDGSFAVKGLPPGRLTFSISLNEASRGFSIARLERDGIPQRDGIEIGSGEQITGVRIVLAYGKGVVRGQVVIAGGSLPSFIQLLVFATRVDNGTSIGTTSLDARGQFRLEHLPPGEYEIKVYSSLRGEAPPPDYEALKKLLADIKQRVSVGDGESQANLLVDLSRKGGNQ